MCGSWTGDAHGELRASREPIQRHLLPEVAFLRRVCLQRTPQSCGASLLVVDVRWLTYTVPWLQMGSVLNLDIANTMRLKCMESIDVSYFAKFVAFLAAPALLWAYVWLVYLWKRRQLLRELRYVWPPASIVWLALSRGVCGIGSVS